MNLFPGGNTQAQMHSLLSSLPLSLLWLTDGPLIHTADGAALRQ